VKDTLQAGATVSARYTVDKEKTIDFMGDELRVYATPMMVMDVERTCRELMVEHADEGEDSVGARVEIDHMGPTLMGMWVEVSATVAEVDGPKVVFEVEIHDALGQVGRSRHTRFAIDKAKQKGRLEKKAAQAKEAGAL
jgi:predicted thioesterase